MSACATGCGVETGPHAVCYACRSLWMASGEYKRAYAIDADVTGRHSSERYDVAQMDFCNRVRAERQNEVPRAQ